MCAKLSFVKCVIPLDVFGFSFDASKTESFYLYRLLSVELNTQLHPSGVECERSVDAYYKRQEGRFRSVRMSLKSSIQEQNDVHTQLW